VAAGGRASPRPNKPGAKAAWVHPASDSPPPVGVMRFVSEKLRVLLIFRGSAGILPVLAGILPASGTATDAQNC
jgi:hypothetical protein